MNTIETATVNLATIIDLALTSGVNETFRADSSCPARTVAAELRADGRCEDAVVVNDGDGVLFVDAWGGDGAAEWRVRVNCSMP